MTTASPSSRLNGLDGVRAFAVLAVIAAHVRVSWFHGGGVGVDIFFAISGFLITLLILREHTRSGRIDLVRFWGRRILRLVPALLALVAIVDLLALVLEHVHPGTVFSQAIPATPSVIFYFANWMIVSTRSAFLGPFGPLWSLSVEEQFYLIWPIVVLLVLKVPRSRLMLAVVSSAIVIVVAVHRALTFDAADLLRAFGTDYRIDMMLLGALLAITVDSGRTRFVAVVSRVLVAPAITFILCICMVVPEFGTEGARVGEQLYYTFGLPIVGLSSVAIIGFLITHQTSPITRFLSREPFAYTGRISYGMYLWHFPILFLLSAAGIVNLNALLVLTLGATYAVATASWLLIERPLHRRFHARLVSARPLRTSATTIIQNTPVAPHFKNARTAADRQLAANP